MSGLHHLDYNVPDLEEARRFYESLLPRLGFTRGESGEGWISYHRDEFSLCLVQCEEGWQDEPFHRKRPGLNHLAFPVAGPEALDTVEAWLAEQEIPLLYGGRASTGRDDSPHEALYFEDPFRLKLEVVWRPAAELGRGETVLLLNGRAAADEALRDAIMARRRAGHAITVRALWEGGQARRFASKAARAGARTIVAAGGDGTLHEVVNGLRESGCPGLTLGLLPYGTANDFATAAGIPTNDPAAALDICLDAPVRPVDIGEVADRSFLNVASIGLGAEITATTPDVLKHVLGGLAYSLTGLSRLFEQTGREGELEVDGEVLWSGRFLFLAVANGRMAGGGFHAAPGARVDDGRLDWTLIPDRPVEELAEMLRAVLAGGEREGAGILSGTCERLHLRCARRPAVNLDGEPLTAGPLEFRARPESLLMHLPEDCPLLGGGSSDA